MSVSIKSGPKLPPVYKGNPEMLKGTMFAVGMAQGTEYIKGHVGAPIPAKWKDGNPKMQVAIYVVGESGKVVRMFANKVSADKEEGTPWKAWCNIIEAHNSELFDDLLGSTFLFNVKTTYKPNGEVAFRNWAITECAGEDYRPNMLDEWKHLPTGSLPPFYYPGFSPEEMAAAKATEADATVAAPTASPAVEPVAVATPPTAAVNPVPQSVDEATLDSLAYDEDIPF